MRDQLHHDGFIVLRRVLPTRVVESARQRLVELVCGNSVASDDEVVSHIRRHPGSHHCEFRGMDEQGFNLVFASECIRIAAEILGDEILINPIQHVRAKAPTSVVESATGRPDPDVVPWHRDCYCQDHAPASLDMITIWIPLCVVSSETGTLLIASRSHDNGPLVAASNVRPPGDIVAVAARQGDVVVLHKNVLHGSDRNKVNRIRYSLDFRVQTSAATMGMSDVPSLPYGPIATSERHQVVARWRLQQEMVQRRGVTK